MGFILPNSGIINFAFIWIWDYQKKLEKSANDNNAKTHNFYTGPPLEGLTQIGTINGRYQKLVYYKKLFSRK